MSPTKSTSEVTPNMPQDFDYIEGSIKEFPAALKQQISSDADLEDVCTSSRWSTKNGLSQSLTNDYDGRQRKYVLKDDTDMPELPAGRFWYSHGTQIIVVGIPDDQTVGETQYVVVVGIQRGWRRFPGGWVGSRWKISKPNEEGQYEGQTHTAEPASFIWRMQGPTQDRTKEDNGK